MDGFTVLSIFAMGCIVGAIIGVICGAQLGFEKACRIHDKEKG